MSDIPKTRSLKVYCSCMATYTGHIDVPADLSLEDAIKYAENHIDEVPIETNLEYISDSDEIDKGLCEFDDPVDPADLP